MTANAIEAFNTVRYVKNGANSRWWKNAKALGQIHGGWSEIDDEVIASGNLAVLHAQIRERYSKGQGMTQLVNQVSMLIDRPSQHIWITFEDGYMWWCTVRDGAKVNQAGESKDLGHFWLECDRPWSNQSVTGKPLAHAMLPGTVTATAGFRGTICAPQASPTILRLIKDEVDPDIVAAEEARLAYVRALEAMIKRLGDKDFELLIDLVLARTGWARVAEIGGVREGVDIEAENIAAGEIAFVQIKGRAHQGILDDYIARFVERSDRYARMIFAVHSPSGKLKAPLDSKIQLWTGDKVADLVVHLGLGTWVQNRL